MLAQFSQTRACSREGHAWPYWQPATHRYRNPSYGMARMLALVFFINPLNSEPFRDCQCSCSHLSCARSDRVQVLNCRFHHSSDAERYVDSKGCHLDASSPMEALKYIDTLFKEYLLFRGFTTTLQTFNSDLASDRGCGFQVCA